MDNNTTTPQYLYHYTSVETLALILKNKNIKFNPLTVLDDRQEERVRDQQIFGRYIFVSSWTEEERESIPMWNMYSSLSSGIRIKLKKDPFQIYTITEQDAVNIFGRERVQFDGSPNMNLIIPFKDLVKNNFMIFPNTAEHLLFKVEYTSDQDLLEPQIFHQDEAQAHFNLGKLGKHKSIFWDFQKEWRYILIIYPIAFSEIQRFAKQMGNLLYERYNSPQGLTFNLYYLNIDELAFKEMQVMLSPKISDGNRTIVHLLRDRYNPSMEIIESKLLDTIR